jgi:hypothetical protein
MELQVVTIEGTRRGSGLQMRPLKAGMLVPKDLDREAYLAAYIEVLGNEKWEYRLKVYDLEKYYG